MAINHENCLEKLLSTKNICYFQGVKQLWEHLCFIYDAAIDLPSVSFSVSRIYLMTWWVHCKAIHSQCKTEFSKKNHKNQFAHPWRFYVRAKVFIYLLNWNGSILLELEPTLSMTDLIGLSKGAGMQMCIPLKKSLHYVSIFPCRNNVNGSTMRFLSYVAILSVLCGDFENIRGARGETGLPHSTPEFDAKLCADGEKTRICVPADYIKFELPEIGENAQNCTEMWCNWYPLYKTLEEEGPTPLSGLGGLIPIFWRFFFTYFYSNSYKTREGLAHPFPPPVKTEKLSVPPLQQNSRLFYENQFSEIAH